MRSYGNSKYYVGSNRYLVNDRYFVDLGLSVLWAETNVGASSEAEYGSYYKWSETQSALSSGWSSCRLPTNDEFAELINTANCSWNWTTESSVKGFKITSKKEGYTSNSIFLPASGYSSNNNSKGEYTYYWSSSLYTDDTSQAHCLYFFSGTHYNTRKTCQEGCVVRPVAGK